MTASRWPMRWRAVLGLVVHRRAPLEVEEGDVGGAGQRDALAGDAGRADDQLRAVGLLEGLDGARRAPSPCRRRRRAARPGSAGRPSPGSRGGEAKTTSGSSDCRKSSIQASAGPSLPRAARRRSMLSWASRSARSVACDLALELGQLQRLLLQPGDDVALGEPVLLLVLQRDRHDDLALLGQLRQHVLLQPPHEAGAAQVPVDALLGARALEAALEARAGAELLQPAEDPQLRDQLVRVVHHRRAGQRRPSARPRAAPRRAGGRRACAWPAGFLT